MPVFTNINIAESSGSENGMSASSFDGTQFIAETNGYGVDAPGFFGDNPTIFGFSGAYKLDSVQFVLRNFQPTAQDFVVKIYEGPFTHSTPITNYTELGESAPTSIPTTANNVSSQAAYSFSNFTPTVYLVNGNEYAAIINVPDNDNRILFSSSSYPNGGRVSVNGSTFNQALASKHIFRVNMEGDAGAVNDPLIRTLDGGQYYLPRDEKIYCLIDTRDHEDRLVINIKCHVRKCFRSYVRYVFIHYNGYEFTIRLPNLKRVDVDVPDSEKLVSGGKLPPHKNQRINNKNIKEVERTAKVRKYLLSTQKYGDFHLIYSRNKFRFNLRGNPSLLDTANSVGSMKGEGQMMVVSALDYVPGIVIE